MTREQRLAEASRLEALAEINDAYRRAMEETAERTAGRLGRLNAPLTYAAHGIAAAQKRKRAAELREEGGPARPPFCFFEEARDGEVADHS